MKILITGGASGLGEAITRLLTQHTEYAIYITYNASAEKALFLEREFSTVKSFPLDFRSQKSIDLFLDEISAIKPDVLINNAITGYTQNHFHKLDSAFFDVSFKANVHPVICITQRFIAESRKRKSGKIITVLSSAIINKPPLGWSEYVANKAYLHSMAKSWAVENASFGITSNCISPSFMLTNLNQATDDRLIENMVKENPNNMLLQENEVAETVLFMIKATPQLNGSNLIINAGKDLI